MIVNVVEKANTTKFLFICSTFLNIELNYSKQTFYTVTFNVIIIIIIISNSKLPLGLFKYYLQ